MRVIRGSALKTARSGVTNAHAECKLEGLQSVLPRENSVSRAVRSRGFPASMRSVLLLLVLVVLAPLLIVQAAIYTAWYHTRWSEQEMATLETAREVAATFEAYVRDVHRQELAIGAGLAGQHRYSAEEASLFLAATGRDYPSVRSWNWTNPDGKVIASTRSKMVGLNLGDQTYFQELRKGRRRVVSDVLIDSLTGDHMFVIARRIDDPKGSLLGAVVATADVTDLGERAVALYHSVGEAVALFDRRGFLAYNAQQPFKLFEDWRSFDGLLAETLRSGTPQWGVISLAAEGEAGEKYIAARVPVASIGWVAGARRPVAQAMASVYTGLWIAGGLNLLVVVVSTVFAWRTGGSLIRQLRRLQAHAQAIGQGDFRHAAESGDVRELAELAELAAAFNQMGAAVGAAQQALAAANAALGQRVTERTAELSQTTEALRAERKRFQDVLDVLPAYVILLTPDYHVPFANRFFCERFGESNGQRCYEYLFHRTEPCETCETFTVLKTDAPHRWEWTGPDGHNYDIHDFPFIDTDGSKLILEMGIDVTEQKRAEAAVRAVGAYNRRLIEASLDPLVTIGPDGKITDVNAATEQVTGAPRDQLVGTDFADYFTEPEKAEAGYQQVLAEGEVRDYPLTIRHASGRMIDVLYNASVYRDEAGSVVGVFAAARDVTESKRTMREFVETKNFLDNILQSSIKYSIIGKDLDYRILSWNKGAERNYGYAAEQIIGQDSNVLCAPEDIASGAVDRMLTVAYEQGMAEGEFQRVRKDGSRFMASVVVTRRNDSSGRPIGYLLMSNDISEKKQAEEQLRHVSQYARSLIESSLDPLVTISADGKITDVNEATIKVTGVPREQLVGTDFSNYFTEPEKAREGYRQVFANGFVTDYPLTIRHKDGRLTDVLYNASVYRDTRGDVLGVFAAARDVTAQKQASQYARSLIESSLDPLVTISADGKITDVNEATIKVTGLPREQLVGTDFSNYFTEPEKAREGYRQVFANGFVTDYPLTIRHKDGRLTDVLYNASVYKDTRGNVVGVFAAARDITERKRAEAELEKHRHHLEELVKLRTGELAAASAQLQTVFDVVNVGILLIDEQGVVKRVNDTVSRWLGRDASLSVDDQPGDVMACVHALADPAGCGSTPYCQQCPIRNAFQSALHSAQAVHDVEAAATIFVDGRETHLWLEVSVDPVVLDGKRHAILALSNITARKQAEEAMERLASFPRLNPNPIAELDLAGKVLYVNPAAEQLFPSLQETGISHPWLADWESLAAQLRERGTQVIRREVMVGETWYRQTVHYVKEMQRVRLYGFDITDRKRAEEALQRTADQLARSNQELEQFAYVASHDLQEPLRVVNGYVQLIERKYKNQLDAEADEFFHYIVDGAARMQQLITDLLNYSRLGTRGKPFSATSVQTVLDRALANLKTVVEESGATVTHDSLPTIQGDESQLVQLFQNLIGNGIKFRSERPPQIHISARRSDHHWEFAVRDNGIGIEPQYWEQIFVIFQRLHTRQKYPGTGIGLAICKRIVERHGGRIWLDSHPGQGTTFHFILS
jgi:PAS domain S-box-containing protein